MCDFRKSQTKDTYVAQQMRYLGYYGCPYCWGGIGMWGAGTYPYAMVLGYDYGVDRAQLRFLRRIEPAKGVGPA